MKGVTYQKEGICEKTLRGVLRCLVPRTITDVEVQDGTPLGFKAVVILFNERENGGNRVIPCVSHKEAVLIARIVNEMYLFYET